MAKAQKVDRPAPTPVELAVLREYAEEKYAGETASSQRRKDAILRLLDDYARKSDNGDAIIRERVATMERSEEDSRLIFLPYSGECVYEDQFLKDLGVARTSPRSPTPVLEKRDHE